MVDLSWATVKKSKMINLIEELPNIMQGRNFDLVKAYELINGGKYQKELKKKLIRNL